MDEPKTVKARWIAPFQAEMPGVPVLVPNETIVELPQAEAEASDHWQVVGKSKGPTVAELRAQAKALGVTVPKGAKKPAIEKLIAKAQETPAEPEVPVAPSATPEPEPEPAPEPQGSDS